MPTVATANKSFDAMTFEEKRTHMTTGRLTVGQITQIENGEFVRYYVARSRGFVLSIDDQWKFKTPEAALSYGKKCISKWKHP